MKESLSHFYDELYAYARQRVGCAETAGDLVHDAFARVLAREIALEQPRAYLYRVLINLIHDRGRSAARLPRFLSEAQLFENEPPATEMTPLEALASREARTRLREAIGALPVRCREVFVLHRFEGLRQREIAARLGYFTEYGRKTHRSGTRPSPPRAGGSFRMSGCAGPLALRVRLGWTAGVIGSEECKFGIAVFPASGVLFSDGVTVCPAPLQLKDVFLRRR